MVKKRVVKKRGEKDETGETRDFIAVMIFFAIPFVFWLAIQLNLFAEDLNIFIPFLAIPLMLGWLGIYYVLDTRIYN